MPLSNPFDGNIVSSALPTGASTSAKQDDIISSVNSLDFQRDIFGNVISVQPYNHIELRFDAADYADYITQTTANGGTITQSGGEIVLQTSTATNGSAYLISKDQVDYSPGVYIFGGGTGKFTTGVVGSTQRIGITDDTSFTNSVTIGYEDTDYCIRYTRGGVEEGKILQANWDDPCLGGATSRFTRGGVPEVLDPTAGNLFRVQCGLFGYAGFIVEAWSPDNGWITVYTYKAINNDTPVFTSNDFKVILYANKTSGASNITLQAQCWCGGTGSSLERLSKTISDRTLAQMTRSVIAGKQPSGDYTNVQVTTGGNLKMSLEELESGISTNANSQLKTTLYDEAGDTADIDPRSSSLGVISVDHKRIHAGQAFYHSSYVDLTTGTSRQFILATPNTATRIHLVFEIDFEAETTIVITEGVSTVADGTAISELNRDRNSATAATLVMTHTPTTPTGGTVIYQKREGGGAGVNKVGGLARGQQELILKQNTKYLFNITNNSAGDSLTNWLFDWYEES